MAIAGILKGKRGAHKHTRAKQRNETRRKERRAAAEARQVIRDKRTPEEQLARLDSFGITATRERARLALKMQANKEAAEQAEKEKQAAHEKQKAKEAKEAERRSGRPVFKGKHNQH